MKRLNKKISLSILFAGMVGTSIYIYANLNNLKQFSFSLLTVSQQKALKKYLFPYRQINLEVEKNEGLEKDKKTMMIYLAELETFKKNTGTAIDTVKTTIDLQNPNLSRVDKKNISFAELDIQPINLNDSSLKKYRLTSGFYSGIRNPYPGSGYIDFHKDDMIIVSSRGVLAFSKNFPAKKATFKIIKNNIDEYINFNQYKKSHKFSIKDLLISEKSIYISYTEEISPDCWNTSAIYGNINYENINFQKLFSAKECVHSTKNLDNEFEPHQSGGRLIPYLDNDIILSIGDYRSRYLAQDVNSINGKLIKINLKNKQYKIISMGHRNPQGLYFDKENNFLLQTEHGPMGGDEINLLKDINTNKDNIYNFGWPISSAGEHYGGKRKDNKKLYEKYPLLNSHSNHGFIEPLKSFVPSIGISEIVKIGMNKYVVSSLNGNSLYFFTIKDGEFIENLSSVKIGERIRDLKFKNSNLYMFLEDTASIGVLNLD